MTKSGLQTVAFLFIIICNSFNCASAETTGKPGINPASADSSVAGDDAAAPQNESLPAEPDEHETGQESQPVEQPAAAEQSGTQYDTCKSVITEGSTWLDRVHALVKEKTCEPAVWFDNFFGEDYVLLDLRPGTFITLRNSARLSEGRDAEYASDLSISLDLPRWERSLRHARLYFESRSDIDRYSTQPGQPLQPGVTQESAARQRIIGIRIDPYIKSLASLVSIDSGVNIKMQPNAFVRMRYQYSKSLGRVFLIRFSEIAMWRVVEHFSNTLQLDLELKIDTFSFVRWGNSINYIDDTPGVIWNTGISYFTLLTRKSAISLDTSMWGVNDPEWKIDNYRVGLLYRLNFYRPWLFLEIEPEITWPEDDDGRREPAYVLMSILEIQFGK